MPHLIVLFGPPAVGKAAIGHHLAQRTGYRFFHNHLTAEPVAALFGWGGERYGRMVHAIRAPLLKEAAADRSIPGVVFTYVWDLDSSDETATVQQYAEFFESGGGQASFVELHAKLETRIGREGTEFRLGLKPSQRDVEAAKLRQVEMAAKYRMNTIGQLPIQYPHFTLNTEAYEPEAAAETIISALAIQAVRSDA